MRTWLMLSILGLLSPRASAAPRQIDRAYQPIDDSDLSGAAKISAGELRRRLALEALRTKNGKILPNVFPAQKIADTGPAPRPASSNALSGRLLLTDPEGRTSPARKVHVLLRQSQSVLAETDTDADGRWSLIPPAGARGAAAIRFRLANTLWSIQDSESGQPYEWEAASVVLPANGSQNTGTFRLDPNAENGKIGYMHLQFLDAFDFFVREGVATEWWAQRLRVVYPGDADYFSPWSFSLNLTRPHAWSVNLHEFGHAVMAAGTDSHGGGGSHKIDECYNEGLAWSEGWATFFAGAVRLARDDADAKFDMELVPRRAPIRIENVPTDVCAGDTSEWRVAAGLWDIYDTHPDGEDRFSMSFGQLWKAIEKKSMGGFADAWEFIEQSLPSNQRAAAIAALKQNTLLPKSQTPLARMRSGPALHSLGNPSWDSPR